jgi:hypothetical protein
LDAQKREQAIETGIEIAIDAIEHSGQGFRCCHYVMFSGLGRRATLGSVGYNPGKRPFPPALSGHALQVCNAAQRLLARLRSNGAIDDLSLVTRRLNLHYDENPPKCGRGVGIMDELIGRLVADIGIDRATAEKAVGIILNFLVKEAPADKVQPILAKLPGAQALIDKAAREGGDGGSGVMGAGMAMMSVGLSIGQVKSVTRSVIAYTREKAGEDAVGGIAAAIPGLAQFV